MEPTSSILRRFYTEVWEEERLDRIDGYFATMGDGTRLVAERQIDLADIHEWMNILFSLVRDVKVTFLHALDSDDWASVFMKIRAVSRASGKPVELFQQIMSRQSNGVLIESYPQFDLLRFFEQLDQLPEDAYPLRMAGHRLT